MSDEKLEISNVRHGWSDDDNLDDDFIQVDETTSEEPEQPSNENAEPEVPETQPEIPAAEPEPTKQPEPPTEPAQEEKQADPLEILGFSDEKDKKFVSQIHEAYKNGTLDEFLEKSTKDYNKLSDAEILRIKVQRDNPNLEKEDIDFILSNELEKFGITGEDDDADAKGKRLLSIQLKQTRAELQDEQKNYKATAYEHKPSAEQIKAQKDWEDFKTSLDNNKDFLEFERSREISFGDFKAEVPETLDPKLMAKDPSAFFGMFYDTKTSVFDADRFKKTALFASNPDKYAAELIAHGKSLQKKADFDELRGSTETKEVPTSAKTDDGKPKISNVRKGWN